MPNDVDAVPHDEVPNAAPSGDPKQAEIGADPLPDISRRRLLKTSLPVLVGVSIGASATACGASLPNAAVVAGMASDYPPGAPRRLEGYDVFLLRGDEGIAAVSGACPHAGCGVAPADGGGFSCGCHGSTFGADGTVTQGPAVEDLTWYAVRIEDGQVVVDPTEVVPKGTYTAL